MAPITNMDELRAIRGGRSKSKPLPRRQKAGGKPSSPALIKGSPPLDERVWRIPPPKEFGLYTQAEVAAIMGISLVSVKNHVSMGGKRPDKMRTLKCPKGRVVPFDLAAYLQLKNPGVKVEVTHAEGKTNEAGESDA